MYVTAMDKIINTVHVALNGDTESDKALAEIGMDSLSLPEIRVQDKFTMNLKLVHRNSCKSRSMTPGADSLRRSQQIPTKNPGLR